MVGLLVEMEAKRSGMVSFKIETEEDLSALQSGAHILDFLSRTGRGNLERRAVVNHVTAALFSDMLHFVYEGLLALEKRKFSVSLNLLRKPFKENMLIAALACADEEKFFEKLKSDAKNLLNKKELDPARIIQVIESAKQRCRGSAFANSDQIYSIAFDRKNIDGLAPLFDKATHLVTENQQIATEDYNLNFIFKNPEDNDIYSSIYRKLSVLLLFCHVMQVELVGRTGLKKKGYLDWLLFTAIGSYESLFAAGRSNTAAMINKEFKQFLNCPACGDDISIRKADLAKFLICEIADCKACGTSHHFPVGWLLSRIDLNIS